jgi:hypothetical protein
MPAASGPQRANNAAGPLPEHDAVDRVLQLQQS